MKWLKRKGKLAVGLVTVAILALAISGGAILAQEGDTDGDGAKKGMAARVAEILGLGEEEVQDAFKEARRDMQDERFESRMDNLVEKGQITEDEATAAVDWYQSRPENIGHGGKRSGFKAGGRHRLGSRFGDFSSRRWAGSPRTRNRG